MTSPPPRPASSAAPSAASTSPRLFARKVRERERSGRPRGGGAGACECPREPGRSSGGCLQGSPATAFLLRLFTDQAQDSTAPRFPSRHPSESAAQGSNQHPKLSRSQGPFPVLSGFCLARFWHVQGWWGGGRGDGEGRKRNK